MEANDAVGNGSGNLTAAVQDRVLLFVWVVFWIWAWFGGKNAVHVGQWVRHGRFSDVDAAAVLVAGAMFVFSFAPSYVDAQKPAGPDQCAFPDRPEQIQCLLGNAQLSNSTGINAWHERTTMLPVVLVMIVGVLVLIRGLLPWLIPAILVRLVTRLMLLLGCLILGWAIFNPADLIFQNMYYGWGLWAELGWLSLMSLLAMSRPPRFLSWLIA